VSTWGVYGIQGRTAAGKTVSKDDKSAVRWFVRWRVDGTLARRTLPTKGYAKTFHDNLMRAKLMGWDGDERGWPIDPDRRSASTSAAPDPSSPTETATTARAAASHTFAEYCEQVWWPIMSPTFGDKNMLGHRRNMRLAMDLLAYGAEDPRCAHPGAEPGASMLLRHITADDLKMTIAKRRAINDRTAAANDRLLSRAMARGDADITLQHLEASASTVRNFYITLSMIVRSAMQSGHTHENPLLGVAKLAPAPQPSRVANRLVPSIGEVFDLADVIATLGPLEDGRPRGDRFRALVLAAGTLGPRPGELVAHRPDLIAFGSATGPTVVTFEETEAAVYDVESEIRGRRTNGLKHRELGESRRVPALPAVSDALSTHLERGYAAHERTFTSATGRGRLEWGNLKHAYWRPACERVFAGTAKSVLASMPPKTLRKAAITHWLDSGISIYLASDWAGHSTEVAEAYYAGRADATYSREIEMLARNAPCREAVPAPETTQHE
jgi:integrase